jgi:predicted O-methyltransferase YrrM
MQLEGNQSYFINVLIRKFKPKNCLEIGVANGGSSILILNAIKDIPDSCLISLDLNTKLFTDKSKKTGYRVNQYFPELTKNWKLFTGQQPHKFLIKLNMKFDFVFLDTAHYAPGEILNFIELLPFLNENAIFVLHDLLYHFRKKKSFIPLMYIYIL